MLSWGISGLSKKGLMWNWCLFQMSSKLEPLDCCEEHLSGWERHVLVQYNWISDLFM